jgi:hypothetical protein
MSWWQTYYGVNMEAPLVSVLWLHLIARSVGLRHLGGSEWALGICAWSIYSADRLLDAYAFKTSDQLLYRMYRRHTKFLLIGLVLAFVLNAVIVFHWVQRSVIYGELPVALGIFFYFVAVVWTNKTFRTSWPKEVLVGLLFAAGVCIPEWALGGPMSRSVIDFLMLALLVTLNTSAIKVYARPSESRHISTRWLARYLTPIGLGIAMVSMAYQLSHGYRPVLFAGALSAIILAVLPKIGKRWRADLWTLAADAALCSPLLVPIFWK